MGVRDLQKTIHVACRELAIDADDRRALQRRLTGKASMSGMTENDLKVVLKYLKDKGFKQRSGAGKKYKAAPRKDLALIHVLWKKLGEAGALKDPSRAGLNKFIRSQFEQSWAFVPADVDMLSDWRQITSVINALRAWGDRECIDFDWSEHSR